METRVSVRRCDTYADIGSALSSCLSDLGGLSCYVRPGMTVALKCNLLLPMRPEQGGTTHPALVAALARMIREAGATPVIIDSPGGPYGKAVLRTVYRVSGMHEAAEQTGALLNLDTSVTEIVAPHSRQLPRLQVLKPLIDADLIINLPKLKTHGFMLYTGAVKNMFGTIPGVEKAEYHLRMKEPRDFAGTLVDICEAVRPGLTIMDAVDAMEGNGPSAGTLRHTRMLLASPSPYALDLAAAHMSTLPIDRIYTIAEAVGRGLSPADPGALRWLGDDPGPLRVKLTLPDSQSLGILKRFIRSRTLGRWMQPRPVIDTARCIGCGICAKNCPPKTIQIIEGKASIGYENCIRCFCCQELCPEKAAQIRRSALFKWLK
jgi:uncharacterized protein (DUF362 family)/Pyruvate/2-oxoacid:ferredoxin oxidoreductase delta subunit